MHNSSADVETQRQYLERHAAVARENLIVCMQKLTERLQDYDQQARQRPEFTYQCHEEMQRTLLWYVHNVDLGRFMRAAANLMAHDQQFPRQTEEEAIS